MMTDEKIPFLAQFQQSIPSSMADEGATRKTDVIQETTDDD